MSGYRQQIREEQNVPQASDLAIERSVIASWKREWSIDGSPWNTSWSDHFLGYVGQLMPHIDHHEFLIRAANAFEETYFVRNRKIVNFIGSQNSGKSEFFAILTNALVTADTGYTRAFVAAPYMKAAHSTVWSSCEARHHEVANGSSAGVWPTMKSIDDKIIYEKDHPKAGYIELVTVDKIGKLQGVKSRDVQRGFFILVCDEIALFPSKALLDIIDNLSGNMNFICLTGCNFRDTEGLEGMLCDPEGRNYSDLCVEEDHEWDSAYDSITYRFDGHRAPNIVAGWNRYPYLVKVEDVERMKKQHGVKGPKYYEQIRSFPNMSMSDFYVTTRDKINSSGAYDDFIYDRGPTEKVAFLDPGFGGDDCKIGHFGFSNARIATSEGQYVTTQIFEPLGELSKFQIEVGKVADHEWIERMEAAMRFGNPSSQNRGVLGVQPGTQVTAENQIVVQTAEYLREHGIATSRFGFDGSMRASIVQEMVTFLGPQITSFDYQGKPTDRHADATGKIQANEKFFNYATELYFAFAFLVQSCQFRGASLIPTAIMQVCRRKWSWAGKKQKIQPKDEYKSENQGKSPDDADVLVGALEMARRAGLVILERRLASQTGGITRVQELVKNAKIFRQKKAPRLNRR